MRVEVTTMARKDLSYLDDGYWFDYRIRVQNLAISTASTLQLIARHWVFRDGTGAVEACVDRWTPRVVGKQPVLSPGTGFEYISSARIGTQTGTMQGGFLIKEIDSEKEFEISVPPTRLLYLGDQDKEKSKHE